MGFNYEAIREEDRERTEPIKAWRAWRIRHHRDGSPGHLGLLYGIGVWAPWVPEQASPAIHTDGMSVKAHDAPLSGCPCGYWGIKDFPTLRMAVCSHSSYTPQYYVYGTISMWGRVFEWELGWRSQYAYPDVIYMPHYARAMCDPSYIASRYKVDVVQVRTPWDIPGLLQLQNESGEEADPQASAA